MVRDPELEWSAEVRDGVGVLTPIGDLLAKTRLEPERVLRDWVENDVLKILVNCRGLQQIDSAGLSALMGPIPRARRRGGDVVLVDVNPNLRALFQVATLRKYFKVFERLDEAEAYLGGLTIQPPGPDDLAGPLDAQRLRTRNG